MAAEYNGESIFLDELTRTQELENCLAEILDAQDQDVLICTCDEAEEIMQRARRVLDGELDIEVELES